MTSSTVSSERVDRQERRDPYSSETSEELFNKPTKRPKPNENEDHEQVRVDPCHSDIPEWLQEFRENLVDDRVPERRDSPASSHELSFESTPARSADLGNTVFILTSLKTEIARSVRGPKKQGPRAEDALAEPYLVPQILVT